MMIKMMRYFTRLAVSLVLMACCVFTASALDKSYYADNSVLASGKWVKIGVSESGIYQITADDIRRWGLGSDLTQIHVFGYGGKPLSEMMLGDNYADDLPQVPVVRTGDRILFYAQGPVSWQFFAGDMGHVYYPSDIEHLQVQHRPRGRAGPADVAGVTGNFRFVQHNIQTHESTPFRWRELRQ